MGEDVTGLLAAWRSGDAAAGACLAEALYAELRQLARYHFSREKRAHTLQATAMVNELYLRLFGRDAPAFHDRAHLMAVAARQLRRILIDHARRARAGKRGAGALPVTLSQVDLPVPVNRHDILEIDQLIDRLAELSPRAASVVEMRFYGGLEEAEIAEALSVSPVTVKRDWRFARAWLAKSLQGPG